MGNLLTLSTNIPGHEIVINRLNDTIEFDKLKLSLWSCHIYFDISVCYSYSYSSQEEALVVYGRHWRKSIQAYLGCDEVCSSA